MKTMLLLLFSTLSLTLAQQSSDPVRDIDGNLLRTGTEYYVLPVFQGMAFGITLASTRNDPCPLDVVHANLEDDNDMPSIFTPVDSKKGVIRESTDVNIMFSGSTSCNQSNVWMVEEFGGQRIVTAHGMSGNPGQETISNWFKIETYENDYKLVYCPRVCDLCKPVCGDIGVAFAENGRRRLGITDVPSKIKFMKA